MYTNNFTKGLLLGGLLGFSISMMSNSDIIKYRDKRKAMKLGKKILMNSGTVVKDVVDIFK